jgi:outer membrane protein OmpA-like peptidoglycan-associated protein
LTANKISGLPRNAPSMVFNYTAQQLFDTRDSAKLKNQKSLNAAGEYLAKNKYGFAVVVTSAGAEGDSKKQLVLTEARAMVVREYLVDNYGFDDSQLKTIGMGKRTGLNSGPNSDAEWGSVQILIYATGTEMPAESDATIGVSSASETSLTHSDAH